MQTESDLWMSCYYPHSSLRMRMILTSPIRRVKSYHLYTCTSASSNIFSYSHLIYTFLTFKILSHSTTEINLYIADPHLWYILKLYRHWITNLETLFDATVKFNQPSRSLFKMSVSFFTLFKETLQCFPSTLPHEN